MSDVRTKGRAAWPKQPSGAEPDKDDIWDFVDTVYSEIVALYLGQSTGALVYATRDDLYANTTAAAGVKAEVFNDSTPNRNGVYQSDGSGSGSDRWTKISDLAVTTIAADLTALADDVSAVEADVAAIDTRADDLERRANYVATSITGTVNALVLTTGKSISALVAGMTVSFRATPGPNTSSTVTIDLDDTAPEPVKRGDGSDLKPGDLLGKQWQQTVEWTGNAWRLISSSQAVEVAEAIGPRDDDGVPVTDANDVVSVEIEPSGGLAAPAVFTRQVGGVPAGFLRREHLSSVAHLPLVIGSFVFGQSNALDNKATPPLSTRRSGRNMRTFNAGVRAFEGAGTPSENRASLIPHVETENVVEDRGESSTFGAGETFCDLIETEQGWEDYANTVMIISAASGEGSTTIAELMAEEPLDRFLLDVEAAAGFAQSEFGVKLTVPALFWNQIEGNVAAETVPATWKTEMIAAQATLETAINTLTGQSATIPLIIPQTATWNSYGKTRALAVEAAELAAVNDKFILLPSYMRRFVDGVHDTAYSQHSIVGPRVGMLMKRLAINGQARSAFAPTIPISNDREGKFARFAFKTWGDDDLTVDTRLVRKAVNLGVEMFQSNGSTVVTIEKVWVHPREIIVKCSSNPAAGMKYRYACAGSGNGWNSGPRGNIRSTFGDQVQARTMQGVVPVHDWAAACEYTLT
jgi:hypothetical protein